MHDLPNYIVFDIETTASDSAKAYFAGKHYEAPKNYKDPEKIAAYRLEAQHDDMQKAALRWWTGQIVCICARTLDDRVIPFTMAETDEATLITAFFAWLEAFDERPSLIGKNADIFDKPFIIGRAMRHQIGIPQCLRPWRPVADVNDIFGYSARCEQIGKLDDYAVGLAIPGKLGKGTDVANLFNAWIMGDEQAKIQLITYCDGDVTITREMLRRFLLPFAGGRRHPQPNSALAAGAEPLSELDIPFGTVTRKDA